MGAYAELQATGNAGGPETLALMRSVAGRVVRRYRFPPPEGFRAWSDEGAVDTLLGSLFSRNRERQETILVTLYTSAVDDSSLEATLFVTIHNFLKDQAKMTQLGKLRRRLNGILENDSRFARPPAGAEKYAWALDRRPSHLWQGILDELHAAAHRVRGYVIGSLNPSGPTPAGTVAALAEVSHGVIDFADASVLEQDLARVLEVRFDLQEGPTAVPFPMGPDFEFRVHPNASAPGTTFVLQGEAVDLARSVWVALSPEEKVLFPLLGEPLESRCGASGLRRHTVEALCEGIVEKILLATRDDGENDLVIDAMLTFAVDDPGVVSSASGGSKRAVGDGGAE